MIAPFPRKMSTKRWSLLSSALMFGCLIAVIILGDTPAAYTLPIHRVTAIPAFARKVRLAVLGVPYGLAEVEQLRYDVPRQRIPTSGTTATHPSTRTLRISR